ncbi:hypothetical protein FQN60_010253 [Etheostoma spectabile]|uniref:Uncharacterized protein n=1 Tax=Etheostoma spectabile TaxID=54343 RepID=A0A5J5D2K3_9PERO|nr:hypothetical protein FQN60_010253 [Etheostoma spectabile]
MIGCAQEWAGPALMHPTHVRAQQDRSSPSLSLPSTPLLLPPLSTSHSAFHTYARAQTATERASRIFLILEQPRNQGDRYPPRRRETFASGSQKQLCGLLHTPIPRRDRPTPSLVRNRMPGSAPLC